MCGIAGLLSLEGAPVDRDTLARMVSSLAHRGPDGCGLFVDEGVALGHRRLSVVDHGTGSQPMSDFEGTLRITFNGEIFNYLELREDLTRRGHRFQTVSDTEVILKLYREHGEDCVDHLNGEWAFAIWDAAQRRLFLSRDRVGVRPLFYTLAKGVFRFASEVKALFQSPDVPRALDLEALDQFFTFWTPVSPRTVFRGVSEVRPAHCLTVSQRGMRERRYWSLPFGVSDPLPVHRQDEYAERLLDVLSDAIRIRLRADVPVGAYLSGGLDSTVTAALAQRATGAPLRTFSVTFEDAEFDESAYQREAARCLGTSHRARHCTKGDIASTFPAVVWHAETPLLRAAPAPLFLLSREVRSDGYKVFVSGEGADEILGGYDIYKETKIRRFWSADPDSTRRADLLRRLYPYMESLRNQPPAYLRAFFAVGAESLRSPFFSHLPRWELTSRLKRFYSPALRAESGAFEPIETLRTDLPPAFSEWDDLTRAQYLETAHLLPGYILSSQGDRMAMAHGVEGRYPFLDHRVIDFAAALPANWKLRVLREKYLLKRAARNLVPPSILNRTKQPYRAPDACCFFGRGTTTPEYVTELLSPSRIAEDGLFNASAVQQLIAKARGQNVKAAKDNMALLGILSTQLLVHHFLRTQPDAAN